ncbi:unnamed protein product, partial [Vitis vinifera]|uniref:Uncharacterized protein n=1 Tax=Vitis vinifera TaxID=29760 RepID=D7UB51_VITVI
MVTITTKSIVVSMQTREADVDDNISKPGLISELIGIKVGGAQKYKSDTASGSGKLNNSSVSSGMTTSVAIMTFDSIHD